MFIVLLTYKKPLEIIDKYIPKHRLFLEAAYRENYLTASGPKVPRTGGIIISHLKNKEQLENTLKKDPFYIHDLADYEIIEFNPVKYHPNFNFFV